MADRSTKVTLSAQIQGYVDGMHKAAQATRDAGSEAERLAQQGKAIEDMSRTMMVAGGTIAVGMGLAAKAAVDWDSAWAGVLKTVDGSDAELAAVEQGLRDLTSVLPASHSEIAAVAEAAGQLGIETSNVVSFTRTMIDLGETTTMSAEVAATSLARFMNVMGTAQDEVSNLGSSVAMLGNNYATTESEIVAFAQRLAGAGSVVGMSEGDVLGLSAALSSVGVNAEAGGTAFSKVMINIASAVESGSDQLGEFAAVAGMSADQFAEKWRTSPSEALAAFITGLSNAEEQGQSTFAVLEQLGVTEQRMRDSLLLSASAADMFADAMAMGNEAFEENVALTEEAELRYGTTAAKIGIMRNQIVDAAISLGEHLLPAVEWVAEGVGNFANLLGGLDGPMGAVVAWTGVLSAGVLLFGGVALAAVPKIAAFKISLEVLGVTGSGLSRSLGSLARFLTGPFGLAAGAATLTMVAFNAAMDGSKVTVEQMENAIRQGDSALETMFNTANENESGFLRVFADVSQHLENLPALADKAATAGRGFWSSLSFNENAALDSVRAFGDALNGLAMNDLPTAQDAFAQFFEEGGLNDEQAITLINEEMTGFKSTLITAAEAAGLATDDFTLLKIATGEIQPVSRDAEESAMSMAEAYESQANAARAAADELFGLMDALMESNEVGQTAESANARYRQTVADVTDTVIQAIEGVDGFSRSIDENTVEGSKNRDMFAELAAESQRSAAAYRDQETATEGSTVATRNYIERLQEGRDALIEQIEQLVGSREAAEQLADEIYQMPSQKEIDIMVNTAAASAQFHNFVNGLPTSIPLSAYLVGAEQTGNFADGGIVAYANGGVQEFAGGGFPTGIYSGGVPIHKFAEPETGWEAYISGKPSERDRNRQIWADAGARLGVGSGGDVRVSLEGMRVVLDVEGQTITGMIRGELDSALAPLDSGPFSSVVGVR